MGHGIRLASYLLQRRYHEKKQKESGKKCRKEGSPGAGSGKPELQKFHL